MNYPEPTRETGVEYQGDASQPYASQQQAPQMYPPPQQAPQMYPPPQQAPQMYPPPQQAPQMYPPPQQAPQMYPPPQQPAPYPQPIQGYPPQQMPQQMYPGYAPYPQQMQGYMPPINVVVNTTNTNVNENTAMPSFVYVRGVPFLVRVLYFLFIGYWLGTCWAVVALIFTALGAFGVIGEEIGEKMVRLISKMFFL